MSKIKDGKLGLIALIAVVVSSMIGGGAFSLPQNIAQYSATGPAIITWLITGFGLYFVANSFSLLSDARPDLKAGIYMYAYEGFNPFIGFIVAWGYWLMTIFGNVAFAVILMDAMDQFFPGKFTNGNNLNAIICGSILIWGYNLLVTQGVKTAGSINLIGTIGKTIPLLIFVVAVAFALDMSDLTKDFWGDSPADVKVLGSVADQIKNPLLVTLWVFVGVEGAVVLSGSARNPKDVGKATMIGFFLSLMIYMAISIFPYGIASRETLAALPTPSTANVLAMVMGPVGSWIMNIGVVISVLIGWLTWTMLCAEIPRAAGENGTFPKIFAHSNKKGAPNVSLVISSLIMQAAMALVYFSENAWNTMIDITSVMVIPAYLTSTYFLFRYARNNGDNPVIQKKKWLAIISGFIGFIFCIYMFIVSDIDYVMIVPLFLTLGIPLYLWTLKENKKQGAFFSKSEWIYLGALIIIDIIVLITLGMKYL